MDIDLFQHNVRDKIENQLLKLVSQSNNLPYSPLFLAARYSLLAPAKRLRPMLVLAVCESFGVNQDHALIPACAIEMIHTYSLIHDDLPCMDNDDLRRGKPTLHKVYPEWHALLTGDFLLTYAFEVLSSAPHLTADQKLELIQSLAKHAGAHGMIGGQMIDLLSQGQTIDWKILEQMHLGKTSGLIIAALEFGGIISNLPMHHLNALKKAGAAIGVAFQLIDDLLDHTGIQEELGKTVGSDHEKAKATAVSLIGIKETRAQAEILLQTAKENLNCLPSPIPLLNALFEQMIYRKK
jgi:geranylgeranyl diphosphate synthase, type II